MEDFFSQKVKLEFPGGTEDETWLGNFHMLWVWPKKKKILGFQNLFPLNIFIGSAERHLKAPPLFFNILIER